MILLDNGHGIDTKGKRSPIWADGSQLFEYEFNRAIVKGIAKILDFKGIDFKIIVPGIKDIPLSKRVYIANKYGRNNLYLSVHSNAGGGSGFEVFTYYGMSKSDKIANIFAREFKREFDTEKLRKDMTDGDFDKEAAFYVLKYTHMPAVLTENFFMDTERECKEILMTKEGRKRIINYHVNAIEKALQMFPELKI